MTPKSDKEIKIMREGGKRLHEVKEQLFNKVVEGVAAIEVEELAVSLIKKTGGAPSFMLVPDYHWATCVNVNSGVVHGIPTKEVIFSRGDIVSVDVGLYYNGFHTDTSFSKGIEPDAKLSNFILAGRNALDGGLKEVKLGNKIYDISKAIEQSLAKSNLTPISALVGHGIGRALHEDPYVPCVARGSRENSPDLVIGAVLAIEVMYTAGKDGIKTLSDGWTIVTNDAKIAGLFEETIALTGKGSFVLT